jgi:branched-subunit amino acid transport protein
MTIWAIMIGLAIGTFLIKSSFIFLLGKREMPPLLARSLRFIPASILSALVVPQILTRGNTLQISMTNPQLFAGIVAGLVAWRTKNVLLTIVSGMAVLWILQAVFSR